MTSTTDEKLLVPTDGSPCATRAVERAVDLAAQLGAEIQFLYVVDTNRGTESNWDIVIERQESEGEDALDEAATLAEAGGSRRIDACIADNPRRRSSRTRTRKTWTSWSWERAVDPDSNGSSDPEAPRKRSFDAAVPPSSWSHRRSKGRIDVAVVHVALAPDVPALVEGAYLGVKHLADFPDSPTRFVHNVGQELVDAATGVQPLPDRTSRRPDIDDRNSLDAIGV
ncbi:MAG: hypothetical protein ACI91T_002431 [Natronomonas sp.]|jgi:hypothetical protein